jgi:hypothetical protein
LLVFSSSTLSHDLGFVDRNTENLDINVRNADFAIRQSPGILRSNARTGTTGAMVWKVTPLVGRWLADKDCLLWRLQVLHDQAIVVELGCGISGLLGLVLAPLVSKYLLTDQSYVMKLLKENIDANRPQATMRKSRKISESVSSRGLAPQVLTFDWETDSASNIKNAIGKDDPITMLIACDCVYNDYLIKALVNTCVEVCAMTSTERNPTLVLVAQQLRSDEIFAAWIMEMAKSFLVWRMPDRYLSEELKDGSGFVIHVALLKPVEAERKFEDSR